MVILGACLVAAGGLTTFAETSNHHSCAIDNGAGILGNGSDADPVREQQCKLANEIYLGGAAVAATGAVILLAGFVLPRPDPRAPQPLPPGWYADPRGPDERWWNGREWTTTRPRKKP